MGHSNTEMPAPYVKTATAKALVDEVFAASVIPTLTEYIKIPNKSPSFDPDWKSHGHMDEAMQLIVAWCKEHALDGMQLDLVELPSRTPLLCIEIPGEVDETVLLYGHMDKQPEMTGWEQDLGPWTPVLRGDRLYGRGGADDGYAVFASLAALMVLREQGIPHARCVILIEASEESGSPDLPYYIEHLRKRIDTPDLVICLDSGAGNYDQLWCTTSLRGMVAGNLFVDIIREGVHSGDASGIVPSSFRILRMLLSRIEREQDGTIVPDWLFTDIPRERVSEAQAVAREIGDHLWQRFPWLSESRPVTDDPVEMILNRTWRPQLAITGVAGIPELANAGNVLRPGTALRLSLRLPPGVSAVDCRKRLTDLLLTDPPYGAAIRFESAEANDGWNAPPIANWLECALTDASNAFFGKPPMYMGEGGTIPFMAMLGEQFPSAQFLITGVLGPESNAHGPNEFLHIPTAKRLSCCVSEVLAQHAKTATQ